MARLTSSALKQSRRTNSAVYHQRGYTKSYLEEIMRFILKRALKIRNDAQQQQKKMQAYQTAADDILPSISGKIRIARGALPRRGGAPCIRGREGAFRRREQPSHTGVLIG